MALVTVQRSPSPSRSAETEEQDVLDTSDSNLKSPRQRRRRSKSALKKLRKLFNTVRFVTKLKPCESYFTVKGAAVILPQSDETAYTRKVTTSHAGDDIQTHLQAMFSLLRPQDTIKVAVKLEGTHTRYLVVVSCIGRQDTEESVILGMDLLEKASVGLILPVWAHMHIQLDGDGGFSIQSDSNIHIFKPVSVQAMWSALQSLNKVVKIAKDKLYIPRGLTHTWVGFYEAKLTTEMVLIGEWSSTADIDKSYRTDKTLVTTGRIVRRTMSSPVSRPSSSESSGEEDIYMRIRLELKNVMMTVDLEEVTCLFLRRSIEEKLGMDLKKYKSFIDTEMMEILGQMDSPSKILDHLYLGSEWNASNLEELENNGVHHILNISREIDNFFPGILHYMNVREWDVDQSYLLKYWEDTFKYINKARRKGSKALVHCKMGISRSASTVIAYLMKEKKWSLQKAYEFTKAKRSIINPNPGFWKQLETYEGILTANWNRDIFSGPPAKPMSPLEEGEELPEGLQCYANPQDFLAFKMGKDSSDSSELPFIHVEQDIELASRSADSTEDSLPDQLSPASADNSTKRKFKYSKSEGDKPESGDFLSSSSESDYTSSEELSSDDEAEVGDEMEKISDDRESKVFIPINTPEAESETVEERKTALKVEGRRCRSESDKNLLSVDETMASLSREGSVSKFKPDGSWIKPASESETENNETVEIEATFDEENKIDDNEGLWMGDKPEMETDGNEESEKDEGLVEPKPEDSDTQFVSDNIDCEESGEQAGVDPYIRENIPWNPGMVKKQTKDLEDKFGGTVAKKKETGSSIEEKSDEVLASENIQEPEIVQEETKQGSVFEEKMVTTESTTELPKDVKESDQVMKIDDDSGSESPKSTPEMKKSVYEEEEIDLPEGIVRKTTMEIEERNRSLLDLPGSNQSGSNLKRSSSLKSTRVTPKAKDRDNERRKTCIALLSPTNPDYTEREQSGMLATSPKIESADTGSDQGQAGATSSQASNDSEEDVSSQTGTVKVYKFMGEELTVQEGLVRKQTMDIESKSQEPQAKQQTKTDVGQELYSSSADSSVDSKQASPVADSVSKLSGKSSTDTVSKSNSDKDTKVKSNVCSEMSKENVCKNEEKQMCDKVDTENTSIKGRSSSLSLLTPVKRQSRPESRFDPETLELIREIGSALLNSPAKSELEENEKEDLKEGDSLVSHYVRKIEKSSGVGKRKPRKQIVIIDKSDSSGEQKSQLSSPSGKTAMTQSASDNEQKQVTSKWSPVSRKQTLSPQNLKEKEDQNEKVANPKWSPVSRKDSLAGKTSSEVKDTHKISETKPFSEIERGDGDKSNLTLNLKSTDSDTNTEMEDAEEVCSVKKLLGKFEMPEQASGKVTPVFVAPSIVSPCSNTQFASGAKQESASSLQSSPSTSSALTFSSELKGQGQAFSSSRSPLMHRQSEPVIRLSDGSVTMFESKLKEMGTSLYNKSPVTEESDRKLPTAERRQGEGDTVRPKSASYGPAAGRKLNLRKTQTLSESRESEQPGFTWEGKKVRKLYGKTHPLAKLEGITYRESARNSPFYNTM